MSNEESEYERRALERLVFFSDAVVAIAITLLAIDLPVPTGATVAEFLSSARDHGGVYLSFLAALSRSPRPGVITTMSSSTPDGPTRGCGT